MTDNTSILLEKLADGVLHLQLNRPDQRNALSTPLLQLIATRLRKADQDASIRCVVIAGNSKIFAAGADIDELAASDGTEPVQGARWRAWQAIMDFSKPLIAAVEGWCLGAGNELVLRCDIVIAGRNAQFGQPETNLGIIPGAGGTAILPRVVGMSVAMDMVLTGEPITGTRAHELGLVARLAEDGEVLQMALQLGRRIAERAPIALKEAKASARQAQQIPVGVHLRAERVRFLGLLKGHEKTEGIAAFRQKRRPDWGQ
jgi:enoyl-CoA hydratase